MEYNDLTGTIPYDIDQLQKLGTFAFWKSVYRITWFWFAFSTDSSPTT